MADLSSTSRQDYPEFARERAKRRATTAAPNQAAASKPYGGAKRNRYDGIASPRKAPKPAAPDNGPAERTRSTNSGAASAGPPRRARRHIPDDPTPLEPLPLSLKDEFARVRQGQTRARSDQGKQATKPKRPVRTIVLSSAAVLLVIVGVIAGPMIYRATVAYDKIFEEQVPHNDSPFVVAVDPEGTRTIVTPTPTGDGEEEEPVVIPEWDGEERLTILLLGVDRREDEASRSDTMILVNIDPVTKRAAMLSIPRDLKVIIPGYGVHKINAAYAFGDADEVPGGGPGLTIRTIEANFGITVHHYAQVDFDGFVKIIDTLGGLTIDVPYPIKDDQYPASGTNYMRIYFQPGWQHMDGERVLQYARTRHDDGDGRRSARQQQVLLSLRDQAVSLDLISKAPDLLDDFSNAIRTDLEPGQALQLARLGTEIDPSSIIPFTLDDALYEEQLPGQPYYLVADWNAVGEILSEFTGAEVLPPMSALADPNYDIEIVVEDGTFNPGLGDRIRQVLHANGFLNVTVVDKPDLGNYPTSSITADTDSLTTAYLVAGVLGLDLSAITVADAFSDDPATDGQAAPTPTPSTQAGTGAASPDGQVDFAPTATPDGGSSGPKLVIVIGDDAPDPAYFTAEPFADEPLPDDAGVIYEEEVLVEE